MRTRSSALLQAALLGAALGVLGLGCAPSPRSIEYAAKGDLPVTADGLHRIRSTRLNAVYLRPGSSFAGYDRILFDPVTVSYKRPPRKPTAANRDRGNFALPPADMERMKQLFQQAFEAEISKSEVFALADAPGPNVLRIAGHIVDLVVDAPPQRGSERSFVLKAGEMTLVLDVRDSETGEPLARVADRRAVQPASGGPGSLYYSTAPRTWGEVERRFRLWAAILREGLDTLKDLPDVPQP
ncbi:MAG: DUF3313 domain-containing protein [Myxococcales bacterium]|nr:DUF3313 domain-containing protein [Myxococcales bacterium]MDH5305856.1 DUF3313 domain-containing protein [Myxococcales bacterium]MDH5565646.1 DUF3313 domain-containing protein [Myxococcales bacterium]